MVNICHICTNGVWFYHSGVLFRNPKCRTEGALCAQVQFSWEGAEGVVPGGEKSAINTTHPPLLWSTFLKTRKTHVTLFWRVILQRGAKLSV